MPDSKCITPSHRWRNAIVGVLCLPTLFAGPAFADRDHGRVIEVRRAHPPHYRAVIVPRERFYRNVRVARFYGPRYPGFGYYYNDRAAWAFLGLTAWSIASYAALNEAQLRAHEQALAEAATAPISEPIIWSDGGASGTVTPIRDGRSADGRLCREFQQQVVIGGKTEDAFGTACQEPDGSWKIVKSAQ